MKSYQIPGQKNAPYHLRMMPLRSTLLATIIILLAFSSTGQEADTSYRFNTIHKVDATSVKDQHRSGTCWAFAAASFLESEILRKGLPAVDLSEMFFVRDAYMAKASNYVQMHGAVAFSPGGQAHDVMHTVRKHGMITEEAYNGLQYGLEKHNHSELHSLLESQVKVIAKSKSGKINPSWIKVVEATVDEYLGEVPESVSFAGDAITAAAFVNKTGINPDDYIELTSYTHHPFYTPFRLEVPDNWTYNDYYNVPVDDLMQIMDNAFANGYSVCWDGDVSEKGFSHNNGVAIVPAKKVSDASGTEKSRWSDLTEKEKKKMLYSFEKPVAEKKITQEDRQEAFSLHRTTDDHLMHLTGVAQDQNGTRYYITKNSWNDDSNEAGGYLNMSEAYVRLHTIAIMVHKDAIPKNIRKKIDLD